MLFYAISLLIFNARNRNFVEFCMNLCFTGFHLRWPAGFGFNFFINFISATIFMAPQVFFLQYTGFFQSF